MKSLYICMGSACHLKSAQFIVEIFRRKIQEHQLEDVVELKSSFLSWAVCRSGSGQGRRDHCSWGHPRERLRDVREGSHVSPPGYIK